LATTDASKVSYAYTDHEIHNPGELQLFLARKSEMTNVLELS